MDESILKEEPRASKLGQAGLSRDRLARVLALIEARYGESLRVEDLAREVGMSPFHFARMFKQSTGHSPHHFITLKRMERARELLASTQLPLAKVSECIGYATQAHFTGVFRAFSGVTPNVYRRARRANPGEVSAQ